MLHHLDTKQQFYLGNEWQYLAVLCAHFCCTEVIVWNCIVVLYGHCMAAEPKGYKKERSMCPIWCNFRLWPLNDKGPKPITDNTSPLGYLTYQVSTNAWFSRWNFTVKGTHNHPTIIGIHFIPSISWLSLTTVSNNLKNLP